MGKLKENSFGIFIAAAIFYHCTIATYKY